MVDLVEQKDANGAGLILVPQEKQEKLFKTMSSDTEALREWIDQLEQILSQLDTIQASIAAIHVDIAIGELCQLADIERTNGSIKAA